MCFFTASAHFVWKSFNHLALSHLQLSEWSQYKKTLYIPLMVLDGIFFCESPAVKSFCDTHCNLRSQAVSGKKITDTVDDFVEGLRHFDKEGNGR